MGLPRLDVVFRLWQCDKQNHGWREGPPLTVPCQDSICWPGLHPPGKISSERKKNTPLAAPLAARSSIRTLAGLKRQTVKVIGERLARLTGLIVVGFGRF